MFQRQSQMGHKLLSINAKPMGTILNLFVKTRKDYSFAVNSMKYLYQLMYLKFIFYKLKLIDVFTIPTLLSIFANSW